MRRDYGFLADGQPVQLSYSWEPLAITGGIPIREQAGMTLGFLPAFRSPLRTADRGRSRIYKPS
ncbi:hypothetical protein [Streptomyces sp. CMSTAAHL-2]|uniref:hypothetical protein n=1 Tax=Streptomyces sp. CMSTAAHL-2 TaxID=2904522 RepID=UPI001E4CCB9D|nr:hypothetical protein [Streptomyces sp. CMSTAAHL-2]MCE3029215.1 hypothetical protein [Streptomyces sp. CMSTAAHL-2]